MHRYILRAITVKSITDISKNEISAPLGVVQCRMVTKAVKQLARARFQFKPHEIPDFYRIADIAHWRHETTGEPLCGQAEKGRRLRSQFQDVADFVNCRKCLKKLEGDLM